MTHHISKNMGPLLTTDPRTKDWQPDRLSGGCLVPLSRSARALPGHPLDVSLARAEASRNQRVTILLSMPLIERLRNPIYWTGQRRMAQVDAIAEMEQANGGIFPPRLTPLKRGRPRRASSPQDLSPVEPPL